MKKKGLSKMKMKTLVKSINLGNFSKFRIIGKNWACSKIIAKMQKNKFFIKSGKCSNKLKKWKFVR